MNKKIIECIPSAAMREYLTAHTVEMSALQQATIIFEYAENKNRISLLQSLLEQTHNEAEKLLLSSAIRDFQSGIDCISDLTREIYYKNFPHEGFPLYPFLEICNLPVLFREGSVIRCSGRGSTLYYVSGLPRLISGHCDFSDECYLCHPLSAYVNTEEDLGLHHEHIHVCEAEQVSMENLPPLQRYIHHRIKTLLSSMKLKSRINEMNKIIVLGVGRTGCQAVEKMLTKNIEGVAFADVRFQVSPDVMDLFNAPLKFNLQSEDELEKIFDENFRHAAIIFVIGGGILAPRVARAAKNSGILTVGIPLSYDETINANFREASDAFMPFKFWDKQIKLAKNTVESLSNLITKSNLDVDDVKNILRDVGTAFIGTGWAESENRAKIAALQAMKTCRYKNAKRVLINITTGKEISLQEMTEAAKLIEEICASDAQVIWGHVINRKMGDDFQVTFIAGLDDKKEAHNNSFLERSFYGRVIIKRSFRKSQRV